jgi:hypothetical protein
MNSRRISRATAPRSLVSARQPISSARSSVCTRRPPACHSALAPGSGAEAGWNQPARHCHQLMTHAWQDLNRGLVPNPVGRGVARAGRRRRVAPTSKCQFSCQKTDKPRPRQAAKLRRALCSLSHQQCASYCAAPHHYSNLAFTVTKPQVRDS